MFGAIGAAALTGIDDSRKIDMAQRAHRVSVTTSDKANADNGNTKILSHSASFRRVRNLLSPCSQSSRFTRPYLGFLDSTIMYDIFVYVINSIGLLMTTKNAS